MQASRSKSFIGSCLEGQRK